MKDTPIQNEKDNKKDLYFLILVIVICSLIVILTTSFAFFSYKRTSQEENTVRTGDFNILVDDHGNEGINQRGVFPVYDEVGRNTEPYSFTLTNLGTVPANYRVKLVPDEKAIEENQSSGKLLQDESIKVQLIKDGKVVKEDLISNLKDYELDKGYIGLEEGVNKTYNYELRLWIDSQAGAEVMGREYYGRIDVELIDPLNDKE